MPKVEFCLRWSLGVCGGLTIVVILLLAILTFARKRTTQEHVVIHFGIDWPPYQTLDDKGELFGFNYELLLEVSKRSGIQFHYIIEDWYRCVDTSTAKGGGNGWHVGDLLAQNHFELCAAWAKSAGRQQVFWQGTAWSANMSAVLYVRPSHVNEELSAFLKSVAVVRGWVTDLATAERVYHAQDIQMFSTPKEAAEAVLNGKVNGLFMTTEQHDVLREIGLLVSNKAPNQTMSGVALLTSKKGSNIEIATRLDKIIQEVLTEKIYYSSLCNRYTDFPCLDEYKLLTGTLTARETKEF